MSNIRFHFLDVEDGDCTLIEFPTGRIGLIDIHTNHQYNLKTIEYIKKILNGKSIFRFILTHPHRDHIHGIKDLIDAGITIENFWHIYHEYKPDVPKTEEEKKNWEKYKPHWDYYEQKNNKLIFYNENCDCNYLNEDKIKILSPSKELDKQAKEMSDKSQAIHRNNYVFYINHGNFMALFCGDADITALNYLIQAHSAELKRTTLLKTPHHGTEAHFSEDFVKICNPRISILFQGDERAKDSAEKKYEKIQNNVVRITKIHHVIVIDGFEDGTYKVVKNGNYEEVLNHLGK